MVAYFSNVVSSICCHNVNAALSIKSCLHHNVEKRLTAKNVMLRHTDGLMFVTLHGALMSLRENDDHDDHLMPVSGCKLWNTNIAMICHASPSVSLVFFQDFHSNIDNGSIQQQNVPWWVFPEYDIVWWNIIQVIALKVKANEIRWTFSGHFLCSSQFYKSITP